ncbi:MAG TPA: hypothetical protein VJ441_03235, partial [Dehalococcoidia bacterium]|nr:hypothetical protein [Dehalococcoidia bacterium]
DHKRSVSLRYSELLMFQSSSSLVLDISYSEYLRDTDLLWTGVKPGLNTLTIALLQRWGAEVKSLRVLSSSSIEHTTALPPGAKQRAPEDLPKLPEEEESKALDIAMGDPRVQELLMGKEYAINLIAPCDWGPSGDARVDIYFKVPYQIEYDWPWPPIPVREEPLHGNFWVREMVIAIDLEKGIVTGISPSPQPLALPSERPGAEIPQLTEEEKARAKEIALADPRVRELIAGKNYEVARKYGEVTADTRIGVWHTSEDLRKIGAAMEIWFEESFTIKYDWPIVEYDEERYPYPHYREQTISRECIVQALFITVNLAEGRVVEIQPLNFGVE